MISCECPTINCAEIEIKEMVEDVVFFNPVIEHKEPFPKLHKFDNQCMAFGIDSSPHYNHRGLI